MIVEFAVYSTTTGEILRTGQCLKDDTEAQVIEDDTDMYIGSVDEETQKIDLTTLEPTDKTDYELVNYRYQQVKFQIPPLSDINGIDDNTLNIRIEDFFLNQVNATTWRIENYIVLRKAAYSSLSERADAAVKISSEDADLILEGQEQLAILNAHDLAVKERFPKE